MVPERDVPRREMPVKALCFVGKEVLEHTYGPQ